MFITNDRIRQLIDRYSILSDPDSKDAAIALEELLAKRSSSQAKIDAMLNQIPRVCSIRPVDNHGE